VARDRRFVVAVVAGLGSVLLSAGCGRTVDRVLGREPYDAGGAYRLAAATGLGSDTPPGFVLNPVGVTPADPGGPGLVPLPGASGGPGGSWTLGDGGIGLSEWEMMSFYVERMMQHNIRYIYAYCAGPPRPKDTITQERLERVVMGWSSSGPTRFHISVSWSGSVEKGWGLNQEIVVDPELVDLSPRGKRPGKMLEFRCFHFDRQLLLDMATKYGYETSTVTGDTFDPTRPPPTPPYVPYKPS
jgi:hypothetical protein